MINTELLLGRGHADSGRGGERRRQEGGGQKVRGKRRSEERRIGKDRDAQTMR